MITIILLILTAIVSFILGISCLLLPFILPIWLFRKLAGKDKSKESKGTYTRGQ